MTVFLTAKSTFEQLKEILALEWVAGKEGGGRSIDQHSIDQGEQPLVGWLNCIHPSRIQVLGNSECTHLDNLGKNSRNDLVEQLFACVPLAVIITDDLPIPEDLKEKADYTATPLFRSRTSSHILMSELKRYLSSAMSEKAVFHGVFMDVMGIGVFITGESGIGKSELALELLSRGHRLVADDAPEFSRIGHDTLNGKSSPLLQDFIEVRGLGILNVRSLYGDSAVKHDKNLRLIVNLKKISDAEIMKMNRLDDTHHTRLMLDVEISEVVIPVAPGRNLAVMVESAVSNYILRTKGYNTTQEFIRRQRKFMEGEG
jgi:HPr kinase/phosphorylase